MWPFKKRTKPAVMVNATELAAKHIDKKMREAYPIGCMFPYLGRRCMVIEHREFAEFVPLVMPRRHPRLICHYTNDVGEINCLTFDGSTLEYLLRSKVIAQKFMTVAERHARQRTHDQ